MENKNLEMMFEFSLFALFIIMFPFVRKDILVFAFYVIIYFYILRFKRKSIKYLGLSTIIAITWVYIAKDYYIYTPDMVKLFELDVYPMLAWALGLLALRELYDYIKPKNNFNAIIILTVSYIILLISLETISYHFLGFKNSGFKTYPGLPICDCIHVPLFMQIYYLTIGPIYYMLTILLDKFIKKE